MAAFIPNILKKLPSMRSSEAKPEAVSSSPSSLPVATAVVVGEVDVTGATVAVPATTVSDSLDEDTTASTGDEKGSSSELKNVLDQAVSEPSKQDNVPQQLDLVFSVDCTGSACSLLTHRCVYSVKQAACLS
jgi:hypothetical protein